MLGKTAPVIAASAVALAVAVAGLAWVVVIGTETTAQTMIALTAVGLSGAALVGLLPEEAGYLIVFVALIGIGMELPPLPALAAGFIVFAAVNLSFLVAARLSPSNIIGNDVGAAFLFTVGLFIRSARAAQARARADQARAEGLLAELRASQAAQAEAAALTERTRLAREIHDILAHSLSGLVLALDTAELLARRGGADPDAAGGDTAGGAPALRRRVRRFRRVRRGHRHRGLDARAGEPRAADGAGGTRGYPAGHLRAARRRAARAGAARPPGQADVRGDRQPGGARRGRRTAAARHPRSGSRSTGRRKRR